MEISFRKQIEQLRLGAQGCGERLRMAAVAMAAATGASTFGPPAEIHSPSSWEKDRLAMARPALFHVWSRNLVPGSPRAPSAGRSVRGGSRERG